MNLELKRRTISERNFLDLMLRFYDFRRSFSRKRSGKKIALGRSALKRIFTTDGVLPYKVDELGIADLIKDTVQYCNKQLGGTDALSQNRSGKDYLRHVMRRDDFPQDSPVIRLAFDRNVVALVADLIGDYPVISDIALLYSPAQAPNLHERFTGSQNFHMDADDNVLCKLWVILQEVTTTDGPTVIVKKHASTRIAKALKYKKGNRIKDDSIVTSLTNDGDIVEITGTPGDVVFINTAGVFHYGSRVSGESKGRFLLMISYSTSFAMEHGILGKDSPMKRYITENVKSELTSKQKVMLVDGAIS